MKFGLEAEKHLYSTEDGEVFHGVLRLVDALGDYAPFHGEERVQRATNEFVVSLVEMNSIASGSTVEVVEDYLKSHWILSDVARRENVHLLPLGSIPFSFDPAIIPKWSYYVQNSILSGKKAKRWTLSSNSPLLDAANCAGVHAHVEIKTQPEYLWHSRELADKHNLATALTPLIALSSSPYFYGAQEAHSMRALRYYYGVYKNHPLNGGLPPIFKNSEDVLRYTLGGVVNWISEGTKLGFDSVDLEGLVRKKGANWGFVRWNRSWNTVELRFLESDFVDLDVGKFLLVALAFRKTFGEHASGAMALDQDDAPITEKSASKFFSTKDGELVIPSSAAIRDLVDRAIRKGLTDPGVAAYVEQILKYSESAASHVSRRLLGPVSKAITSRVSTSEALLRRTQGATDIPKAKWEGILKDLARENDERFASFISLIPDFDLSDFSPRRAFPQGPQAKKI